MSASVTPLTSGDGAEYEGHEGYADARMPPQDLAAEQSVLGGMLLSKDVIGEVTEVVTERDFYRPAHASVFNAVLALYNAGEPADAVTVASELERRGELGRVGGAPYLHTLIATVPTAANAGYYAEIVAKKATLRRLVEAGTRVVQLGYAGAGGAEVADVVDRAQAAIHDATTDATRPDGGAVTAAEAAADVLEDLDNPAPRDLVRTGLDDLDGIVGGLETGEITVVCGRPGHGKTLLGLQIVRNAVLPPAQGGAVPGGLGKSAFIFSLEMSRRLLMQRMLAATTRRGIRLDKITRSNPAAPPLDDDDWQRLGEANTALAAAKLWIDDSNYQTTASIRTSLRRHVQQHGVPDVVMIDYLGLITTVGKVERRDLAVAEITRDLKILAGELGTAVLLLHQLNRNSAQRNDKRPMLADLRDSGAVEQDAFAVLGIYTPQVDDRDDARVGEADISVMKNRQGRDGTAVVGWQGHYARLADLAPASTTP